MNKLIELLLVITLLITLLIVFIGGLWIWPIFLGIKAAKEKHRSPHWMWFGIHPIGGWIALAILRSVKPMNLDGSNAQATSDLPLEKLNQGAKLERQRWFWVLWTSCFVAQITLSFSLYAKPDSWPWFLVLIMILFFATAFSLIPLMWFILGDYGMNKWWLLLAMVHPVVLIVPVCVHLYSHKNKQKSSSA
ncbi:MAG: hypothetical protein IPP78_15750 [Holophagaceae bacterium]|nr:hypothetical protein [Holophagaceae bacterium]